MGSAFATCFGYWFGISGLLWVISYVCNTRIAITQLLNLLVKGSYSYKRTTDKLVPFWHFKN
jgi:hypothetical protein